MYFSNELTYTGSTKKQQKSTVILNQKLSNNSFKRKNKRKTTKLNTIGISENDLWIAATVLRHSLTLVSSDSDFERMRQVREISWESWV